MDHTRHASNSGRPVPASARPSELVASYASYPEAHRTVDVLVEDDFPGDRIAIAAGNLRFVEGVTGRLGYASSAAGGAASGAITGALFGFVLGLFTLMAPLSSMAPLASGVALAIWGALFGAIVGAIVGLVWRAIAGRRRDFSSAPSLQADRFDVVATPDVAARARQALAMKAARRVANDRRDVA